MSHTNAKKASADYTEIEKRMSSQGSQKAPQEQLPGDNIQDPTKLKKIVTVDGPVKSTTQLPTGPLREDR